MKGRSTSKAGARKKAGQSMGIAGASLFGACVGLIACVALALTCSVICALSKDPDKLMTPLSMVSLVAVYLLSGLFASRKNSAALPTGLMTGSMLALFLWLVSLFFGDAYSQGLALPIELLIRLSFIAVSLVGSLIGTNARMGKRRRRR